MENIQASQQDGNANAPTEYASDTASFLQIERGEYAQEIA
jgi:hypothetical protein